MNSADPDRILNSEIRRLRRRVRILLIERYGLLAGAVGAAAAAVLVLLSPWYTELLDYRIWIGAVLAGGLIGSAFGLIRKLGDLTVAIAADKRSNLKERLSTAVALSESSRLQELDKAVISDASENVRLLRSSDIFRHRFGVPHIAFGAALLLLLGAIIVPQIAPFHSRTRQQEVATMKKEGAKIVKVAKEVKKQAAPKQEELRKLAARLERLGKMMQSGRMQKKQAMLKTRRLGEQIKKEQDRLARQNSTSKSMQQARAEMRRASRKLAKHIADQIARKEHIPPEEALQKVVSDERLAELARKSERLTPTEQRELERAIAKYADSGTQLPIPQELAEALLKLAQNEDYRKAMELMQKLAQKLKSGAMSEMDEELLRKQLEELAKALKGTDLDRLAKMMLENAERLAQLSPAELEQLLKEIEEMRKLCGLLAKAGGT